MRKSEWGMLSSVLVLLVLAWSWSGCTGLQKQLNAAVRIDCGTGFGSGVIVGRRTVVTAAHVVRGCAGGDMYALLQSGERWKVYLVKLDVVHDVARLRITGTKGEFSVEPIQHTGGEPRPGDRVCLVIAAPHWFIKCGVYTGRYQDGSLKHSAITMPGNSGAGLYNADGELIGIETHYIRCGEQFCGGVAADIQKALDL